MAERISGKEKIQLQGNEKQSAKNLSDMAVFRKLFVICARHNKSTIIVGVILAFIEGMRPYIPIVLSGILIDGLAQGTAFVTLLQYTAAGLTVNLVFQVLSSYLREYFNARMENCLERQNRDMNKKSMEIDYEHLENPEVQEKKRKQEQVVNVRGGIYWMLIWPLDKGLTGLISVITAAVVTVPLFVQSRTAPEYGFWGSNWPSLFLLLLLAGCVYGSYKTRLRTNKRDKAVFEEYAKCNKVKNYFLHDILFGSETAKDLRIFRQEGIVEEGACGREEESRGFLVKIRRLWVKQEGLERTLSSVSCGCVYLYAALRAYMGLISIGSVVRYASSIIKCIDNISMVLNAISGWRRAIEYGRDYLDYMSFENRQYKGTLPVKSREDNRFQVEFDHVSFRYPGSDVDVIKDLSLKLDIGEKMAIVGRNGSGKTTFIKLLCRLYDVTEGTIRVNGVDIREYNYEEYLKLFSVVFQDYRMFSLKVGENIAASENVDKQKAVDALEKAGLGERFAGMEEGLDTYVGKEFDENGVNVSGGERQKMAIARAIYKGAPFVIMDEPTAALDPVSECDVYAGFDRMVGTKTAIYISHRLASCRFCNDILVFDRGNVVQRGSHEELVQEDGLYRKLWEAQAQYYEV